MLMSLAQSVKKTLLVRTINATLCQNEPLLNSILKLSSTRLHSTCVCHLRPKPTISVFTCTHNTAVDNRYFIDQTLHWNFQTLCTIADAQNLR